MDSVLVENAGKVVLKGSDYLVAPEESRMEFVLTYAGPLVTDGVRPKDKHTIRRYFHPQLKRLWDTHQALMHAQHGTIVDAPQIDPKTSLREGLAQRFQSQNHSWVPLVRSELALHCCLDFLILRPEPPGEVNRSGDLDNRVGVLVDALSLPNRSVGHAALGDPPTADEKPFFVLLEDDRCVTRIVVETSTLLERVNPVATKDEARVVVKVTLTPQYLTGVNFHFLGHR